MTKAFLFKAFLLLVEFQVGLPLAVFLIKVQMRLAVLSCNASLVMDGFCVLRGGAGLCCTRVCAADIHSPTALRRDAPFQRMRSAARASTVLITREVVFIYPCSWHYRTQADWLTRERDYSCGTAVEFHHFPLTLAGSEPSCPQILFAGICL